MTSETQQNRLEGPKAPKGRVVLQQPPELEPSDGVNTLLTSLVPLLGTASAMVMMLMTNSGLTGMLTGGMFMVSSLGFVVVNGFRQRSQRMANLTSSRREYLTYLSGLRKTVRQPGANSVTRRCGMLRHRNRLPPSRKNQHADGSVSNPMGTSCNCASACMMSLCASRSKRLSCRHWHN